MKTADEKVIINVNRDGYATDQIYHTMTVGELIEMLSDFNENLPVYFGNDRRDYGWYTYGGVNERDIELVIDEMDDEM